jgi:hypothetical protein
VDCCRRRCRFGCQFGCLLRCRFYCRPLPVRLPEVDDEVLFRLSSDREPRCNLRCQQGDPNAVVAVDQSEEDSLDSASVTNADERSFLPRSGAKSALARANYPHNVEQEISRFNEHIACLKSQYRNLKYSNALRRKGAMASDDVTADGMLNRPPDSFEQTCSQELLVVPSGSFEQSRSREPLARPSGSLERTCSQELLVVSSDSFEQSRSREPLARPSGSLERTCSQEPLVVSSDSFEQSRSREPLARPSGSLERTCSQEPLVVSSDSFEQSRSREPLARPSGSLEQTCSQEPLVAPSGSFGQSFSRKPLVRPPGSFGRTCSREPLAMPSGSFEQMCFVEHLCSEKQMHSQDEQTVQSNVKSGQLVRSEIEFLHTLLPHRDTKKFACGLVTDKDKNSNTAEPLNNAELVNDVRPPTCEFSKQGREKTSVDFAVSKHNCCYEAEKPPAIRLEKFYGKACLETCLAKFKFISDHFEWTTKQQLLYFEDTS